MLTLFPAIRPYQEHRLAVEAPHELYVEECGNPNGLPIVFIHGGPGAGASENSRRFFDPSIYRIIVFDQRGAGRSTPHASLENNTTQALVADLEKIRTHLKIDRWILFGGSWGSTLSLLYAQAHPERVLGLILRGIFLCREKDIQWFYQSGAHRLFPDYWKDYETLIPEAERGDMVSAYYRRLTSQDELARMAAAKQWSLWEGRTLTLQPNPETVNDFGNPHMALSLARTECHYFMNQSFIKPNQIINDAHKLKKIPGVIVHGRYDVVCPVDNAFDLHAAWPEAQLEIIRCAGHSAYEEGIVDALVRATNEMPKRIAQ